MAKKAAFGVLKLGTPDTPVVVADLRTWRVEQEANEIDTTVMGTGKGSMAPGAVMEALVADLFFESTDAAQAYALANVGSEALVDVELYPIGETMGNPQWTAKGTLMSFSPEGAADGAMEVNGMRLVTDSNGGTWGTAP